MAIPRLTGPLSRYPCAIFCGPDMILIVNGSEPAKHRLQPHTRARHSSWRACAQVTRCKPREWHQRQERRALAAPRSCTKCARSVCHGRRLRQCSRAARRRRSISRAHPMRAHIVRSRGQVAVHGRTPAVAARMPPAAMLVINLRIGAAADCCCGNSSSLLLPDSVKPAVQRGVQNSRGFVPPEAERIRARRPELDGTTRLTETRGTGHGRATEREVASGASDKTTRKTRI